MAQTCFLLTLPVYLKWLEFDKRPVPYSKTLVFGLGCLSQYGRWQIGVWPTVVYAQTWKPALQCFSDHSHRRFHTQVHHQRWYHAFTHIHACLSGCTPAAIIMPLPWICSRTEMYFALYPNHTVGCMLFRNPFDSCVVVTSFSNGPTLSGWQEQLCCCLLCCNNINTCASCCDHCLMHVALHLCTCSLAVSVVCVHVLQQPGWQVYTKVEDDGVFMTAYP